MTKSDEIIKKTALQETDHGNHEILSSTNEICPSDEAKNSPTQHVQGEEDQPASPGRSKGKTYLLMFALCMAVFLAALDSVIVTTALPTIAADFKVTDSEFAWIGAAYLLANASSVPFWGKVSDIFGRRPILLIANAIFLVGSLISALSTSITMLIVGRAVQGLGGGGLIILVNICVSDLFSMRERGMYFGMVGAVWAIASAIGPVIGGAFAQRISWRWCFWINLPCDGISLVVLVLFLDIRTPKTPLLAGLKAIDWLGTLTITGATLMLLLGLEFGGVLLPWGSATVLCLIIFSIVTFVIFILAQWKFSKYPVMPLKIFSHRSNIAVLVVCFCHGTGFISIAYFLPLYFQTVLETSPVTSGVWLLALALPLSVFTIGTGIFIRISGRYLEIIRVGMLFTTVSFGLFINFQPFLNWPRVIIFQILIAIGIGPNFQAPLIALQTLLLPKDMATGTATFGFVRQLSAAVSVVIGQVLFQSQMLRQSPSFIAAKIPAQIVKSLAQGSSISIIPEISQLTVAQQAIIHDAATESLSKMWIFYTVVSFIGLLASFGISRQELSSKHVETKTGLDAENKRSSTLEAKDEAV